MPLTIVHFTTDSLPRVVAGSAGTSALDVLLPFRVDLDDPALAVTGWHLDVEVDGRSWVSRVRTRRLRAGPGRRAARPDGPDGRVHLRPPALLRGPARRRHPRRPRRVPGVPRAGRAPGSGGDVPALSVTVSRDGGRPGGARGARPAPCTPSTRASPATTCGASESRRVPGRPGVGAAPPAGGGAGPVPDRRRRPGRRRRAPERAELVVQVGELTFDLRGGPLPDAAAGRRRGGLGHASPCRHDGRRHCRRSPSVTAAATPSPSTWPTASASAPPV